MNAQKKKIAIIAAAVVLAVALIVGLVVLLTKKDTPNGGETPVAGAEIGTYYFDAGIMEYTLSLNEDRTFVLFVKDTFAGTYTLTDGALALDFNAEGKETVNATLADNVVAMTYNGASYRFFKSIPYTVSFESNSGSGVESQTVINGKTAVKPADPTRDGYLFIGWYADSEFKTPFEFGSQHVTADVTLYARWTEKTADNLEYDVDFNMGYENAQAPASMTTKGGKLFGIPAAEREGYSFKGWWVSMTDDASKLSYLYEEGMALNADTTLYALWESNELGNKLSAPLVNVSTGTISWDAVENARSYNVTITKPNGTVETPNVSGTTMNYTFDLEGEYEIKVVANAQTGEANNSESVRYYTHKQLGKVYQFEVIDGNVLVYNTVANAEKYLVTVVCGNPDHNHAEVDNGTSRTFSFSNCDMAEGGIKFVVKAVADGYATSVSKEFVFERRLSAVEGLRFDEATQTVIWNETAGAAEYMVSVQCGNAAHSHDFVTNGSKNSISLKNCDALEGGIVVKVYPKTHGYNSPEAVELKVNKTALAAPMGLTVNGSMLSWTEVTGATKYEVQVGDKKVETTELTLDISALLEGSDGAEYAVTVLAMGDNTRSLPSDVLKVCYNVMKGQPTYSKGQIFWNPVVGADAYEIQVNDGDVTIASADAVSAAVKLTKSGVNVIKVRFVDGTNRSDWVSTEVLAYTVLYDARGGRDVAVQYKAAGDILELPTTTKDGYTFSAWYNVPGGAASNGKVYAEGTLVGNSAMVLFADYNPNKFEITYNYGEGVNGDVAKGEVSYERDYTLLVPNSADAATVFGGWFSAPYGMGIQYTDGKGNSLAPWTTTEGAEVYAFWINNALKFTKTKVNGKDAYMVSAGERIALVTEVTVPATYNGLPVVMVAGSAFKDCSNLKVVNLPASIEVVSNVDPFAGCTSLEAVNVYAVDGVNNPRFWSEDGVLFDNGTNASMPSLLVMPVAKTGTYRIPANITEIPANAFAGSSLTKVIIPASVTKIGREAFADCVKLSAVTFETAEGEKALTIGARAFSGCESLEKITLPARLSEIVLTKYVINSDGVAIKDVDDAFADCTALTAITVANGNAKYKSVGGVLYSADGKTIMYCPATVSGAYTIPAGVQSIAPGAFIGCDGITEITVPNTVTLIGECAFYGLDDELTKVTFAGSAFNDMTIDDYAFAECSELTDIVFEAGSKVKTISKCAFMGCESLTKIDLPASVELIESNAFSGCESIEEIVFAANGKALKFGEGAFSNCVALKSVTLPANVSELPGIFAGCENLEEVLVAENSDYLKSVDGVLFTKDMKKILFFPKGKSGDYVIPETVTAIADGVFYGITLNKLTIYNTIEVIGNSAFYKSSINTLEFVAPVEGTAASSLVIGDYAFYNAAISDVTLPAHTVSIGEYSFAQTQQKMSSLTLNEGLTSIGNYAFYYAGIGSIVIPSTIKEIPAGAFENASVTSVELKEGITLIGDRAFYYARSLSSITIPASVTSIGVSAFYYTGLSDGITFAENSKLTTIGARAFESSSLTSIIIPKSVTAIGASAFASAKVKTVVFEDAADAPDLVLGTEYVSTYTDYNGNLVTEVQRGNVFYYCSSLTSITLPSRLTIIEAGSFRSAGSYYDGLEVVFPDAATSRLTTIGENAFYYSYLDGEIVIPASVKNLAPVTDGAAPYDRLGIGANAFYGTYITKVTFASGSNEPLTIGEGAFSNCYKNLTEVTLPARLADYTSYDGTVIEALEGGSGVFNSSSKLENIFVENGENLLYASVDGVLYKTTGTDKVEGETRTPVCAELIVCPAGKTGTVTVPSTVTLVHAKAFASCEYVEEVKFNAGESALTIGENAFYRCYTLTSLVLPDNVVAIGDEAFAQCKKLVSLTLPKNLESFNSSMVDYCVSLATINVGTDGKGTNFSSVDGVLYNGDTTVLVMYPCAREGDTFQVPATVKVIGNSAFDGNTTLVSIVLPAGLEKIEDNAFINCENITSITIPNTVTYVGAKAFCQCYALETVVFEENGTELMVIGANAFYYTTALASVKLPERLVAIGDGAFYNSGIKSVEFAKNIKLETLGNEVFSTTGLVEVVLPDGIVAIGDKLFYGSESLEKVTFGDGLVSIGASTFATCINLVEVNFPSSLRTMGINTFYEKGGYWDSAYCEKLTTVTFGKAPQLQTIPAGTFAHTGLTSFEIPAAVTEIENGLDDNMPGAFKGCASLASVTFETGSRCSNIGDYAFSECSALNAFVIPNSVNRLGTYSFNSCTSLEAIVIPDYCATYGNDVFYGCTSLADVKISANATALSDYMFYRTAITSVEIPENVTYIGNSCFNSTALTEVTVPASVLNMGWSVFARCDKLEKATILGEIKVLPETTFEECESLTEVILPATIEEFEDEIFVDCTSLKVIELPASLSILGNAFEGAGLEEFKVAEGNTNFAVKDGVLFNSDLTQLISYPVGKADTSYVVPKEVTRICAGAFAGVGALETVTFEESTEALILEDQAFAVMPSLVEITLPERVTKMGMYMFYGNESLKKITFLCAIDKIPEGTFYYCSSLESIAIPEGVKVIGEDAFYYCEGLTNVVIPETVTTIAANAFYSCESLSVLMIPESVATIGDKAFYYCSSSLLIMTPHTEKPAGWVSNWNIVDYYDNTTQVLWGFDGQEHTYTFVSDGETYHTATSDDAIQMPTNPTKDGFYFNGWYDNEACEGTAITGSYYNKNGATLYADWLTQEEYDALFAGTKAEFAIEAVNGASHSIVDNDSSVKGCIYFKVTATEDVTLTISTVSGGDTVIRIYDNISGANSFDYSYLKSQDSAYDETLTYTFTAGQTYYIAAYYYYASTTGTLNVNVTVG